MDVPVRQVVRYHVEFSVGEYGCYHPGSVIGLRQVLWWGSVQYILHFLWVRAKIISIWKISSLVRNQLQSDNSLVRWNKNNFFNCFRWTRKNKKVCNGEKTKRKAFILKSICRFAFNLILPIALFFPHRIFQIIFWTFHLNYVGSPTCISFLPREIRLWT